MTTFASMIGRGRCSIDAAAELARDIVSIFVSANFCFTYTQSKWKIVIVNVSIGFTYPFISLSVHTIKVHDHDAAPHPAIKSFASLGNEGQSRSNQERDLHRWMKNRWGFSLQGYTISLDLQVTVEKNGINVSIPPFQTGIRCPQLSERDKHASASTVKMG